MRLFRIASAQYDKPFDAEGAKKFGGRWNPRGLGMLYYGTTLAICALEKLVHIPPGGRGVSLRQIIIEVPDGLVQKLDMSTLPGDWDAEPSTNSPKEYGKKWLESKSSVGLFVPSVIIPSEFNVILNPDHPNFIHVKHISTEDFHFVDFRTFDPA